MRVAIASIEAVPEGFTDDRRLAERLAARAVDAVSRPWDDADADWSSYDLVVIRSTWDYSRRREEFLAWARRVGGRLENSPAIVTWNSDKRYLGELAAARLPVVETTYIPPGGSLPEIRDQVVIKPAVSGGARDTGRFGPGSAAAAAGLAERIGASGRTAMLQPFMSSVDSAGETAVVVIAGRVSHALRKRAVLGADEVAPTRDDALGAAEAMYDPGLVSAFRAELDELELARAVIAELERRFGAAPLYARVDMLRDSGGSPVVLELEAIEPNLYLDRAEAAADRLADAIVARLRPATGRAPR